MSKVNKPPKSFEESSPKRKSSQCSAKKVAPDGGWGWMIVFGSFIGMILGTFPVFSFSILFSPILMSHSVSSTKTAWIYNVHSLVWSLVTLFIGPLCDEFGWRKVAMFGGITNSISVILSAFAPNPEYLFFSFSLLGGVGGSTALSLSFFVVSRYFDKHRGFALGITTLGGCASSFLAPIVANYLLEHFGYTGATLIFGAIVLNQCVGGSLYQPVEWHLKSEKAKNITEDDVNEELLRSSKIISNSNDIQKKTMEKARRISAISELSTDSLCHSLINITNMPTLLEAENNNNEEDIPKNENSVDKFLNVLKSTYNNLKSLKYMRVNLIAWGHCGLVLGYINFQMWIPFVITNAGHSLEMAAWCSSFASIGNVIGRLVMSLLSDRKFFNVRYGYMFGLILIGSSIIAFSLVNDIRYFLISTCGWGLGIGCALSLNVTVMINVMGVDMLPAVLGIASLFKGFGGISIGTLTGVIRDATSSYTYALWMLGGCEFMAFCMWLLMPFGKTFDEKKHPNNKKQHQASQHC